MRNIKFLLILLILIGFLSVVCHDYFLTDLSNLNVTPERAQILTRGRLRLDKIARLSKFEPLYNKQLSPDDLEIRVWSGGGIVITNGLFLKKTGTNWSAVYLPNVSSEAVEKTVSLAPQSEWSDVWRKLENTGFLTLPDETLVPDAIYSNGSTIICPDCPHLTVEINYKGRYRIYSYSDPRSQKIKEAQKLVEVIEILFEEFEIELG